METKLKITGNLNELKSKLKQKYPSLTDADLTFSPGKEDELVAHLSKKLDKNQEEVSDIIHELQSKRHESESESGRTERDRTDRDQSDNDRTDRERRDSDRSENESKQNESKKENAKKY